LALKIGILPQMFFANLRACMAALAIACLGLWAAPAAAQTDAAAQPAVAQSVYRLDTGDQVKMTVYGEDDLSGTYTVDGNGNVQLPLIGEVHAGGLSIMDFQAAVAAKLSKGYLVNPRVSAEVANYRPFTILGEVNKPGEYPYENGMSVLNAVALAGGFTYRADEDSVFIRRKGSSNEIELPANDKTLVNPGDTVRVSERIF
jgi:polysaccharide export outer membrane protein